MVHKMRNIVRVCVRNPINRNRIFWCTYLIFLSLIFLCLFCSPAVGNSFTTAQPGQAAKQPDKIAKNSEAGKLTEADKASTGRVRTDSSKRLSLCVCAMQGH